MYPLPLTSLLGMTTRVIFVFELQEPFVNPLAERRWLFDCSICLFLLAVSKPPWNVGNLFLVMEVHHDAVQSDARGNHSDDGEWIGCDCDEHHCCQEDHLCEQKQCKQTHYCPFAKSLKNKNKS
jgi:hypothetical protein